MEWFDAVIMNIDYKCVFEYFS